MEVTNIIDVNITITTQVDKYINHLVTKDSDMAALTRMNIQLQWKIKNIKRKLPEQNRKENGGPRRKTPRSSQTYGVPHTA